MINSSNNEGNTIASPIFQGKIGVYLFKVNLEVHTFSCNVLAASCIEGFQDIMLITFALL